MQANLGIKGFIPTSLVDWPGRICSVLFLGGCNFRCPACHNRQLVVDQESLPEIPLEETVAYLSSRNRWIDGVTVTGGEPTTRKSLPYVFSALRDKGVSTKLDTNGSNPRVLDRLIRMRLVDAVFMDVKAPLDERRYQAVAGVPVDLSCIEESIDLLLGANIEVTFRTTAIPGLVEEPQLAEITRRLGSSRRFLVQSFRRGDTLDPSMAARVEFSMDRVERMKRRFETDPAPKGYPVAV
jgi:pyruvate formate lyase activating enzyme